MSSQNEQLQYFETKIVYRCKMKDQISPVSIMNSDGVGVKRNLCTAYTHRISISRWRAWSGGCPEPSEHTKSKNWFEVQAENGTSWSWISIERWARRFDEDHTRVGAHGDTDPTEINSSLESYTTLSLLDIYRAVVLWTSPIRCNICCLFRDTYYTLSFFKLFDEIFGSISFCFGDFYWGFLVGDEGLHWNHEAAFLQHFECPLLQCLYHPQSETRILST